MRAKYALFPGHVISRNDGQRHYIGAGALARLYRVSMRDCIVVPDSDAALRANLDGLVCLGPRFSGDYQLPKGAK